MRSWIKRHEADMADNGQAVNDARRIKQLEKENKELQRANVTSRRFCHAFALFLSYQVTKIKQKITAPQFFKALLNPNSKGFNFAI
ncbi:hypothetical protein JQU52_00260 [Paralysiella testudinis]|uniref:Transposase n=1 Tax=Paralysiella testudinis TaxID=2809020 RepID=A0A892ZJ23_9NEIS|nr:hypothetical protein JQU52_00260 [Paralysiella testudinis]